MEARYGRARANWIDLDGLIEIKSRIDHPRHQEDVRVLQMVRERRGREGKGAVESTQEPADGPDHTCWDYLF